MKKLILIFLQLAVCTVICNAQTPGWLWLDGSGGSNYQYGAGIGTDDSGFHYISGRFGGTITFQGTSGPVNLVDGSGNVTPFVGKFDENGNCIWLTQKTFGWDYPRGFCTDKAKNNNEYVTGNNNSGDGMFVYKFDNLGNLVWPAYLGTGSGNGYGGSPNGDGVAADSSGNVYVTGETGGGSWVFGDSTLTCGTSGFWPQAQEMFLTKLDKNGNFLWAVGAEDANGAASYDVGRDVVLDKSAQYVFVCGGYQNTPLFHSLSPSGDITAPTAAGSSSSFFVAKYDTAGNLLFVATATNAGIPWSNGFNSGVGAVNSVAVDSCDDIFVTGYYTGTAQFGTFSITESNSGGQPDGFVASCNSKGQWQWVKDIGSSSSTGGDYGQVIALDKDNDVYAGGVVNGTANFGNGISLTASSSQGSLFLAKYANSTGDVQWAQGPAGSSSTGTAGIAIDTQKFVYIDGTFNGTMTLGTTTLNATTNQGNIFIAKLDTVPARYIVPVVDSSYCPGSTVKLPYTIIGSFNSGNVFTAQLSDSSGSFVGGVDIGDTTATTGGYITITIPANAVPGSTYLIRVVSSNPATSSYVNGCGAYYQKNVYINNFYVTIGGNLHVNLFPGNLDTVCSGATVTLKAAGGTTYIWSNGGTADSINITPTKDTTYSVIINNGGCIADTSINVVVTPAGSLDIEPQNYALCYGSSVTLYVVGGGTNFTWTPSTGLNQISTDSVLASPTANITYTVTGNLSGGCAATGTDEVDVIPAPNKPAISKSGDVLTSSATQGNQWYVNDSVIAGASNQSFTITHSGCYAVSTINPANGCTATSDTLCATPTGINQLYINSDQLSIYPNPTTGELFINISASVMTVSDWNLRVTDVLGRTLFTKQSLSYNNDIDLFGLSGGVYFITITNKTERAVSR